MYRPRESLGAYLSTCGSEDLRSGIFGGPTVERARRDGAATSGIFRAERAAALSGKNLSSEPVVSSDARDVGLGAMAIGIGQLMSGRLPLPSLCCPGRGGRGLFLLPRHND
jgi:hypothetical protein